MTVSPHPAEPHVENDVFRGRQLTFSEAVDICRLPNLSSRRFSPGLDTRAD
jgi:hypothetical protein